MEAYLKVVAVVVAVVTRCPAACWPTPWLWGSGRLGRGSHGRTTGKQYVTSTQHGMDK